MGHSSGVAALVFVAVLVVRLVTTQRRRSGGRPGGAYRGFTAGSGQPHPAAGTVVPEGPSSPAGAALGGTDPGWFRDPFVRHEQRYWSGDAWTEHVSDGGVPGTDPPPPPREPVT